jgi:hypothetical protein
MLKRESIALSGIGSFLSVKWMVAARVVAG